MSESKKEEYRWLDSTRKQGELVMWKTIDGKTHYGRLSEFDSNVAIVVGNDNREHAVEL